MSHTPGPWHIHWGTVYPYIRAKGGAYILDHNSRAYARSVEDALLIAAAPEMLAALKRAFENRFEADKWIYEAEQAIAKAEGRAINPTRI